VKVLLGSMLLLGCFVSNLWAEIATSAYWDSAWQDTPKEVFLGLPFTITLVSINSPVDVDLEIQASRDWKVERQKLEALKSSVPTTIFRLNCIALSSGNVKFPKVELISQQGRVTTPELTLAIKSPIEDAGSLLELKFSKHEFYERETLVLQAKWITTLPLEAIKALKWIIPCMERSDVRVVEMRQETEPDESKSIGLPIGERRIIGTWEIATLKGEEARALSFEVLLQPQQAGELTFENSFLVYSVERDLDKYKNKKWRGNRYPSYFNNNFFEATQKSEDMQRMIVISREQKIKVKALPPKPVNLKGDVQVGYPMIRLSAEPKKLQVGESLQLTITVASPVIETFDLSMLNTMAAFDRNFRTPSDRSAPSYNERGEKVYVQTLWPKRADLTMVPPIVLACFDPEKGFYLESESNSVAIEVTGGENSAFNRAEFAGNEVIKSEIQADPEGIWHHVWRPSLQPEFSHPKNHLWRWLLVIFTLLAFAISFFKSFIGYVRLWLEDSGFNKTRHFNRALNQWRTQSQDRECLRSIVLEHLANHLKDSKARYDEKTLFEKIKQLGAEREAESLKSWLHEQDLKFSSATTKVCEGEIQTIVLKILGRRLK